MGNKLHKLLTEEQHRIANDLSLPGYVKYNIASIINCRTMNAGGYILFCPDLHGGLFLYNSCKTRGCPVCMEAEQLKWFFKQKEILLPVKHQHLIFKVPSEINSLWLYNSYLIQTILFDAAKYAVKKVNRDSSIERGWISVLHTAGGDLSYHPHLHTLISNGGFDNKQIWQESSVDIKSLRKYYCKRVRKKLLKALNKHWLFIPKGNDPEKIKRIINTKESPIQQMGIYSHGEGVLKYFSKKLKTGPINTKQIISYDNKIVTFYYMREGKKIIIKLKREEFLRRYLNHLPLKGFRGIRNYGFYSPRHIKKTKELRVKLFNESVGEIEYTQKVPTCPVCGKELTVVKSCSVKEFKELFAVMKKAHPDRPPPAQYEFVRMNNC